MTSKIHGCFRCTVVAYTCDDALHYSPPFDWGLFTILSNLTLPLTTWETREASRGTAFRTRWYTSHDFVLTSVYVIHLTKFEINNPETSSKSEALLVQLLVLFENLMHKQAPCKFELNAARSFDSYDDFELRYYT